ncbi:MAG: RNA 2',3'-cyclic phosphodiesterase [Tissierellia bacterium]|nr:RNA 2',3'-cyclic phosphodiesterase [Tissierellia bacterium]
MRLFIAMESEEIQEELAKLQEKLQINGRKIKKEQIHLTLKFIGEQKKVEEIRKVLRKIAFSPMELEVENLGTFPGRKGSLLYLKIKKSKELEQLYQRIEQGLFQKGIPRDQRKYLPHITLARNVYSYENQVPLPKRFLVDGYHLKESCFTENGVEYHRIESYD